MKSIQLTIDVAYDIEISDTPAAVFAVLTKDIGGWWGHPFVTAWATSLALDPQLGGLFTERWDNGGHVIASVTGWAQDEHLQLTGSFHMGAGVGVAAFDLAESAAGTLLRFSFRAIGVVDPEVAGAKSRAWAELTGTRLKGLVETGTRLGIDPDKPPTIRPHQIGKKSSPRIQEYQHETTGQARVLRPARPSFVCTLPIRARP